MTREGYYNTFGVSYTTYSLFQDLCTRLVVDEEEDPAIKFVLDSASQHKKLKMILEKIDSVTPKKEQVKTKKKEEVFYPIY